MFEKLKANLKNHNPKSLIQTNGDTFLGYRVFFHNRLLRKRNINYFKRKLKENKTLLNNKEISKEQFDSRIAGWMGYASFGNTHNLVKRLGIT